MIIGFDGSRAFTENKTGTENYSYQLLQALARTDRVNQYIIYTRPFINETAMSTMKISGNFKVVKIPWIRFWTQGGLSLQTFKDPLDVLFVPAHTLPLIRKPGLKTVMVVHDLGAEYLPQLHQLKQQLYLKGITKFQLKSATKLIAVSIATKDDLVKKVGCDPKKIEIIYEGYDKEKFQIPNSKFQNELLVNRLRQYDIVSGEYFLFVGTVQPRKNLTRVIKAFSTAPHFLTAPDFVAPSLVIVGQKGWLSDEIYKLPKQLGIEDKVKFLGYVPEKDLPALYSGAIALVFPSLFEGFGLPILEAQACGCPVITSNVSSMLEVAGKGAILVNPHEIDDIVRGMKKCQISNVKSQIVKAGFNNVKKFSWEKCARETLRVLETL